MWRLRDGSLVDPARCEERYARHLGAKGRSSRDQRTETERDRGRISYSPFLRRLAGVTQVTSPDLTATRMHSRASHSYKVATVAREIAENLVRRAMNSSRVAEVIRAQGGLDVSACEAAGLAHDMGHPPFGHAGEQRLDAKLRQASKEKSLPTLEEGFEGNAQSFRIVSFLDLKDPRSRGLDLTNVTLAAIQKYPHLRKTGSSKFGAYESEALALRRCREAVVGHRKTAKTAQSLEASVMDLADDIAYAVHDLEDFCGSGAIDIRIPIDDLEKALRAHKVASSFNDKATDDPFTQLALELKTKYNRFFDEAEMLDALGWTHDLLKFRFPSLTRAHSEEYLASIRAELSDVVSDFFAAVQIKGTAPYTGGPLIYLSRLQWHRLQCLKRITRGYLVSSPKMGIVQRAQTESIDRLFDGLASWLSQYPDKNTVPSELKDFIEANGDVVPARGAGSPDKALLSAEHYRSIVDYICGMSDSEAAMRSQWVSGGEVPVLAGLGG
jgi:dGTPase